MPKKILLTYTNHKYYVSHQLTIESAKQFKEFDEIIGMFPWDIDERFREENREIFKWPIGDGYWLWKPYIIKKTLEKMSTGDILFYIDSDTIFVNSPMPLIQQISTTSEEVLCWEIPFTEKAYTKRDCFKKLNCDTPEYTESWQRAAGFSIWQKGERSMKVASEWLSYCQDRQLITDLPSKSPNYKEFRAHRHDGSIFSLVTKKHKIRCMPDPLGGSDPLIGNYKDYWTLPKVFFYFKELLLSRKFFRQCNDFYKKHYGYSIYRGQIQRKKYSLKRKHKIFRHLKQFYACE